MNYFEDTPTNRQTVKTLLKESTLLLLITKADESKRNLFGTLKPDLIDWSGPSGEKKMENPDVQVVWDTEADGWRSFRWDRLNMYSIVATKEELGLR